MINICEDLKSYKEIQEILDYLKDTDKEDDYIRFIDNIILTRTYDFITQFMYEMSNETIARLLWGVIITAENDYKEVVWNGFTKYSDYNVWGNIFHTALKTDWRKTERDRKRKEKEEKLKKLKEEIGRIERELENEKQ